MVPYPYTVVDPGAVVVKALYAVVAYGAVARPSCAYHLAVWTQLSVLDGAYEVGKVNSVLQIAGLGLVD